MENAHNHIIEKVFVEIDTKDSEIAFSLKNHVSEFLKDVLIPRIELLFDDMFSSEQILRIEKMEVRSHTHQISLNESVANDVIVEIETTIKNISKKQTQKSNSGFIEKEQFLTKDINDEQLFLNFIQTGVLPWYAGNFKLDVFLNSESWDKIIVNKELVESIWQILAKDDRCLERFVKQIPLQNVVSLFAAVKPDLRYLLVDILMVLKRFPIESKFLFLAAMFKHLSDSNIDENWDSKVESFFSVIKNNVQSSHEKLKLVLMSFSGTQNNGEHSDKIKKEDNPENLREKNDWTESKNVSDIGKGQHIQNAGLVLLHPFLKNFFVNSRIAGSTGKIEVENLDLAVQALHFIATGQESAFENELVFEKFLCGLPAHYPIIRESLLTEEIKTEAEEMLTQVIEIWSVLKNTSVQSFRESFIQRNGILYNVERGYNLIVEAKSWDILLEKLPWNYSLINWYLIDKLIFVEWQYEGV